MTQQPSWTRFSLHLVEFVVLAAALAALEFYRRGPFEGEPFLWTGLVLVVAGIALVSGLSHAALGMAKARSTDPEKYEDLSW